MTSHEGAKTRNQTGSFSCLGVFVAVTSATLVVPALAQRATFRSQTALVALNVTVVDDKGLPIRGLSRDSFTVTEDDRPQPITQFANDDIPLSLVLALDASGSMKGRRFDYAVEAVMKFMDRLRPNDELTVLGFNDRPFNVTFGTTNRDRVREALGRVQPDGSTALYAAVNSAIDALRMSMHRKQALVVISDGNDYRPGDRSQNWRPFPPASVQQRAIPTLERIKHSETLVYAIGVDASDVPLYDRLDATALRAMTDSSGGSTVIVRSNEAVTSAAELIGDELRQQYAIGFVPAHPADGKFHHVKITVKGCACHVRARRGFVADKPKAP